MRLVIAILSIVLLPTGEFHASRAFCLAASQARIFPLGTIANNLIVVETRLGRGENFGEGDIDELKPYWNGICYLKVYDNNHKELSSRVIDTLKPFNQDDYLQQVNAVFDKGLVLARRMPGFIEAKPLSIVFGDYQEKCTAASLSFDTINNSVDLRLKTD